MDNKIPFFGYKPPISLIMEDSRFSYKFPFSHYTKKEGLHLLVLIFFKRLPIEFKEHCTCRQDRNRIGYWFCQEHCKSFVSKEVW